MKYSSRLISNVRALFGFGRGLMAFALLILPFVAFLPNDDRLTTVGDVYFKPVAVKLQANGTPNQSIAQLHDICAELQLKVTTPEQRNLVRLVQFGPLMISGLLSLFVCHWMWRLCRNVEGGEVFVPANFTLLRRLGGLLILEAIVSWALAIWSAYRVADYAKEHASLTGLELVPPDASVFLLGAGRAPAQLDLTIIIIGLLVLCLAEVFRQGLRLKQEADLTV